ncbi:sigma-54-dependent transcriptional regulator [Curvivirga aplysinae]|uniref:sigma-54-dependent transcriptional regulator n=1 Tax=Curvivirga aplysinae TaxID=2529852 RepID=UPI0012BBE2DC|nr:sigma-54 dependent transcriptional regulator [Curvivirga aplysinae]MTI11492.1 sigma-54-dependent Fis family transcriptional regulator [Curvivirga aplysinae]
MSDISVILIDDEEDVREAVTQTLQLEGLEDIKSFARADRALEHIGRGFDGVVISDIRMPHMDGMEFLKQVGEIDPDLPVILITGHGDVALAVEAMRVGAYDFVEKPFAQSRLIDAVRRGVEKRQLTMENRRLMETVGQRDLLEATLRGRSQKMVDIRKNLRTLALSDADILLLGETGTGKDLTARLIHDLSSRKDKPFVALNISALPQASLESELFGHEAGAFAGAMRARVGKLEHARGGTLYLDEIGSIPLFLQVKLLRMIEDRVIERLGSNQKIDLDIRIIAASKDDLSARVTDGAFRDDLYYRLAVASVTLPPLRDRMEDAPELFHHLVGKAALRQKKERPEILPADLNAVAQTEWPGNIRELRNAADRFVMGLGLPQQAVTEQADDLATQIDRFEKNVLAATLASHAGSLKSTYESLGLSRKSLYEKMKKHGLQREDFAEDGDD